MTASRTPSLRRLASVLLAALGGVAGSGAVFAQEPGVVRFGPQLDFFNSPDFAGGGGPRTLSAVNVFASDSGGLFIHGRLAETALGRASWVCPADADTATRIDLRGADFSPAVGGPSSTIHGLVGAHFLHGGSTPTGGGAAAWMASAATGATTRIGLWDASGSGPLTSATGAQTSTVGHATVTGYLAGVSILYQGGAEATGQAAWLSATDDGSTTRIGLHGTPEFTGATGQESATINQLSDAGWAAGVSLRYDGGATQLGQAAWVANGTITHRVGLIGGDASFGAGYSSTDGAAHSAITGLGVTHVAGASHRYVNETHAGYSAWFASLADGQTVRIGLWDETGSGTNEFTSIDGAQNSGVSSSALVGGIAYICGASARYMGGPVANSYFGGAHGIAGWVHNTATGETTRLGLAGDEFTKLSGETDNGLQLGAQASSISAITGSGYIWGYTLNYSPDTADTGQALWVSHVDDLGAVVRVGLHDPAGTPDEELEYTEADRTQSAFPSIGPTESGHVAGTTSRWVYTDDFGVGTNAGRALWVASAVTGQTHRIGFTEGFEYTSNVGTTPHQTSQLYTIIGASELLNEKARVLGYSQRYKDQAGANVGAPTIQLGQSAWIADAATGETTRIGLWEGAVHEQQTGTRAGTRHSVVTGIHAGTDHVWGYSQRYTATATNNASNNRTAWIHHVTTGAQTVFELAQSDASGLGFSTVGGMSSGGIAYGHYTTYEAGTDTNAGNRAFVWSESLGTRTLDDVVGAARLADHGWAFLSTVTDAEDDGAGLLVLVGQATLVGGGTEAYRLTLDLDGGSDPGPGGLAAFLDWLSARGLPATVDSHDADPDGDGVPALLEFALGEPADAEAGDDFVKIEAIVVEVGGTVYPGIRYTRRRDTGGVALAVEHAGGDLAFPSATELHPHATSDLGGGVDEVEIRSATPLATEPRQFFRLRAILPE